ncbi:sigma-54-dependent Fis family transcriptional regulator [Pseudomonas brenneri]
MLNARRHFSEGGDLPIGLLPAAVADSWFRSRASGLMPSDQWQVDSDSLVSLSDKDHFLADCIRPQIERLWRHIGGASWTLFCVNPEGVIVHSRQTQGLHGALQGLEIGRRIQEADIGTTAPSCTIAGGNPAVLIGNQHYLDDFSEVFCASVPIRGLDGNIIGALDITGTGARQIGAVLEQLSHAAMTAENRLFNHLNDCQILSIQHDPLLLGTPLQGLVAIDQTGHIRNANRAAQRLLGLERFSPASLHIEQLFDSRQVSNLPHSQQLLTLSDGSRLYARTLPTEPKSSAYVHKPIRPASTDFTINRQLVLAHKAFAAGVPILVQGETGTGKEVFARTLHEHWNPKAPFVAINCSAIPESLIESELFGHAEGTFTGARKGGYPGQLAAANGGTLLLDEIGDMPLALQTRLLRVLQEREIPRLGSAVRTPLNVRLISATHCDLAQRITQNLFREDLYYRLNGLVLTLPSLRERGDFAELVEQLLQSFDAPPLHPDALQALQAHHWPGNIRQLEQALRLASALASDDTMITLDHLSQPIAGRFSTASLTFRQSQRQTIEAAFQANRGNVTATAHKLGISRTTLYKKLQID